MDRPQGFPALILGERRRPAGGAGFWICELRRDVDIKWVSVNDASDEDVSCTFHEVPGLSWTTSNARAVSRYVRSVIESLP